MKSPGRKLGVCLLTETYHPVTGGGETQARILCEGLQAAGCKVQLITRRSDATLPVSDTIGGVPVCRLGPKGRGHLKKWGMVFTALAALLRLRREYDVMLVCGYRVLGIPAVLAGRLFGKPCVMKADSQGELSGRFFDPGLARMKLRHDRFPVSALIRWRNILLRRAERFVSISAVIEQEHLGQGVSAGKIVRIPNSVDPAMFRPVVREEQLALRARLGIPVQRRVAVFTGRLVTTKGLPALLRAWREVLSERPDALLVLVGSGGLGLQNCEAALRSYVAEHGLEASVLFAGSVDNVHEYLQASDGFVFPTEREAFGISIIEAMACGLPIVTTGVDGIRDIIRPGVDAWVVALGDESALAAAILRMLDGGDEVVAMGEAARRQVLARYSSDQVIAAYHDLLRGLVNR